MEFDGQNRVVVLSAPLNESVSMWSRSYPAHPFALSIYENRLYYTDWIYRAVLSVDKLLGNDVSIHRGYMTAAEQPMGLTVVAEDLPVCGMDECSKLTLKCGDKCVLSAEGHAKCDCHKGRELNEDGLTCKNTPIKECDEDELKCQDQLKCYKKSQQCDGHNDCKDDSDEHECPKEQDPCLNLCYNNGNIIINVIFVF